MDKRYAATMAEMAEMGCPGHGPLLKNIYNTFQRAVDRPTMMAARVEVSLDFGGLTGDVSAMDVHMCHGLRCTRIPIHVLWRETPITTSECMRMTRGIGTSLQHRTDEKPEPSPEKGDRFDTLLAEFGKGIETLRGNPYEWIEAIQMLRAAGSVCYIGANFRIQPQPDSPEQLVAHCCTSPGCTEAPLGFRRCPPVSGIVQPLCDNRYESVGPRPPPTFLMGC